jgi:SPP1 gp7 family putative phage head morphogenesis protein
VAEEEVLSRNTGRSIKQKLRKAMDNFSTTGVDNMLDFAEYEANFSSRVFKKHFKQDVVVPNREQLRSKLKNNNLEINNISRSGTRKSLQTAYKQFGIRKANELYQIIRDGEAQKLESEEIIKLLNDRVKGLHSTQARVLANTNINYTANVARNETISKNKDLFTKVIWVSVLDSGTTEYCQNHSGNTYPINEGPRPPAHWGCRSHVEPLEQNR